MKYKPTKYPAGSPKDVRIQLRRVEREVRQMLLDVQSVNDNNPHFKDEPMDTGRYLVQLKKIREVIKAVDEVIASDAPKLPDGILEPICEKW
jgi:hypothetical protein